MKHTMLPQSSFAALFDPAVARAAAERAAQWDLPRHMCYPLDRYDGSRVSSDLATYDAAVDLAPVPEEEVREEPPSTAIKEAGALDHDSDFEDTDDL